MRVIRAAERAGRRRCAPPRGSRRCRTRTGRARWGAPGSPAPGRSRAGRLTRRRMSRRISLPAQGAPVDAHLVDDPLEPVSADRVAADPQRAPRALDAAAGRHRRDLGAVDVQAQARAAVGRRQVGPLAQRDRRRPGHLAPLPPRDRLGHSALRRRGVQGVGAPAAAGLLGQDRAPARGRARLHPGLEGHAGGEVQGGAGGDGQPRAAAVEAHAAPEPALDPSHVLPDRAVAQAGGVAEPQALRVGLVEAVGGDEAVLGGGGGRSPGERQPNQQPGEERDDQRAGGAVRSSRGRDRPSPGGCGRARGRANRSGVGVACDGAALGTGAAGRHAARAASGCQPAPPFGLQRSELVKTAVKSAECGAGPAIRADGENRRRSWPVGGEPSTQRGGSPRFGAK